MTLQDMYIEARTLGVSDDAMCRNVHAHMAQITATLLTEYRGRNRMDRCTGHHAYTRGHVHRLVARLREARLVLVALDAYTAGVVQAGEVSSASSVRMQA